MCVHPSELEPFIANTTFYPEAAIILARAYLGAVYVIYTTCAIFPKADIKSLLFDMKV